MKSVPLQAIPNQQLSVIFDNNLWNITLKTTNGTISATIFLNTSLVIENLRAVAGMRIIPAQYQEAGNFAILTQNEEIPDYKKFSITQYLLYFSPDELIKIRTQATPPITAVFFSPIAPLPLRFAPQNYVLG